ncbi:hypothetical protein BGZ96_006267 [Linnemannia gamsii]|uniref:F-box domain-containing protein n=1 Tax=Linnemannia gamsii TaxID=64522 RepID=A0ABQ7K2N3_9FUNG|nr:hypothetical protein BGZ96_006267 [Linnemannia gamsii]
MTIREIDPAQESVENKHRPTVTTTSTLLPPPVKPTPVAHSDNGTNTLRPTPQPLRAKRKSVSSQVHDYSNNDCNNSDGSLAFALDRDNRHNMQDSSARSWEVRGMTTKQLRLTVNSGHRRRSSTGTHTPPSGPGLPSSMSSSSVRAKSTVNGSTDTNNSPPSTHTPSSNGSLVDEMDLDTHISSPSTVSVDMDVASLSDTLDLSILEEDLLVRQIRDLSSPPTPPPLMQVSPLVSSDSLDDNNNQTSTHQQLLEDARAGKRVNRKEQQQSTKSVMPVLPTELLIKVFECLAGLQADLCSAALVSIEWNLCATGQLYRYPEFANTIHWAMFIQTLCKNKEDELRRPTSRRNRPPIFSPSCLSPHFGDHPPILLAPEQMASFGARMQQPRKRDRLDRTLGEYVRGVDLSRKAIGASRLCPCGRPYGPPVAMKECSVCVRPGKTPSSKAASNTQKIIPGLGGSNGQGDQGTTFVFRGEVPDDDNEDEALDGYMDSLECLNTDYDRRNLLTSVGTGLRPRVQQTSNAGLRQPGQPGSNTAGSSLTSNHFMSLLNWSGLLLSPMASNNRQSLRRFTATRASTAATTGATPTSSSPSTAATITATTLSTTTASAAADIPPITMARSRRMAAGRRGEPLLTFQDESSQLPSNDSHSLQGGAGNRGTISIDKDAISTRKPMTITVSSLIQMARHCPNLEWLCLASTALADDTLYLETGDYMSTLQPGPRSGLTNIQVTVMEGIGALGQSCPNLGRVWLVGCDWVTHREVLALTKSCRRLQMMDVRHCPRLEGRLSRLYALMEGPVNEDMEAVNRTKDSDTEMGKDVVPNEKVAIPLQFETAPTTVLLGANVSGRGVRDGAMDDLFYFVYITAFVSSSNISSATAAATALPSTTTASTTTTATSSAGAASPSTTLSPQAVNDILSLLSSAALAREAPTDSLAFREWFKAVQDFDLVSYEPLKRWKFRSLIGCQPGVQLNSSNGGGGGGGGGASSSSSRSSSSSSISGSNSSSNPQQKYFTYDTDSDSGEGDGNEENLAELDD